MIVNLLTNLKDCMNSIDNTNLILNNFQKKLNNKESFNAELLNSLFTEYNDISITVSNNIITIDKFLAYFTKFFILSFNYNTDEVAKKIENKNTTSTLDNNSLTNNVNKNIILDDSNYNIIENTLIISDPVQPFGLICKSFYFWSFFTINFS